MVPQLKGISKGWLFLLWGFILLLYVFSIFSWRLVLFVVALYFIALGVQQIGGIEKIKGMVIKKKPPQQP